MSRSYPFFFILILLLTVTSQSAVVINEIYYDPSGTDTGKEFLELYNNGNLDVDLSGWQVQCGGTTFYYAVWSIPAGTIIGAHDYLLLGGDSTFTQFNVVPDLIFPFTFQNGGAETDGVRITDEVINPTNPYYDTILYDSPNTYGLRGDDANPGAELCPDVDSGHSLERVALGVDNNLAADWFDNLIPDPTRSTTVLVPPVIHWTMNYPEIVAQFDQIAIVDSVTDNGTVVSGQLFYSLDGLTWTSGTMFDDGMHSDASPNDGVWGGFVPPQPAGTQVRYYVKAVDNTGAFTFSPANAPNSSYSYTVYNRTLSPTIAEIRVSNANLQPQYMDSLFIFNGVVTVTNQFGLYGPGNVQDGTAGICIYDATNFAKFDIEIGDSVRIYGWMGFYAGLTEIVDNPVGGNPNPSIVYLGQGTVTPLVVPVSGLNETNEGKLVKVQNCHFLVTGNFSGGTSGYNYYVVSGTDTFQVRIDESTNIPGSPIPVGDVDLVGVLGQYDNSSPYTSGYQLFPRFLSDILTTGNQPPAITNVLQTPTLVTPSDSVNITARITDDGGLTFTRIWWHEAPGGFVIFSEMFDDGLHGDGAAGDSVFGGYIPPQTLGTVIEYFIEAVDNNNQTSQNPAGGMTNPYTYTVVSGGVTTPILTVREVDSLYYPVNFGDLFTVRGIITSANQFGTTGPAHLQDATAGIAFYDGLVTSSGIAIGDSVELTAYVDFYNGLIQLADDPANANNDPVITILSSGNPVSYELIEPTQLNESYEGQLVRIDGVQFLTTGNFGSGVNYSVVSGADTFTVRIDNSTNIVGTPIPTELRDIIGCVQQYDNSSPYTSGYQLLPRTVNDFLVPPVISPIATARMNNPEGYPAYMDSMFIIEGLVTASTQYGTSGPAYMEDATGAIGLYDAPVTMFGNIGDIIRVTGWIGFYAGVTEIVDHPVSGIAPTVQIISTGNPVNPAVVVPDELDEDLEGRLVKVLNCAFLNIGTFTGNTNYYVACGPDTFVVRIDSDTQIQGNPIPVGPVDITGILGQYDTTTPYFSGYQLLPRFLTDISTPLSPLMITLIPDTLPIVIPATGGAFQYTINIQNFGTNPETFDGWIDLVKPNQQITLILNRPNITLAGTTVLIRFMTQNIPGWAPTGNYSYRGHIGDFPNTIVSESSFPFSKAGNDASGVEYSGGWDIYGWEDNSDGLINIEIPERYSLSQNYPNPFNPQTAIEFALPKASEVKLSVYDVSGRLVTILTEGTYQAGIYTMVWNGSNLASGVYFYELRAGEFSAIHKCVLMK